MRRINSEFQTCYMSEEGKKLSNRDYFGYVEMDDFACYVLADSLDGDYEANSAQYVVESLIRSFVESPTLRKGKLRRYMQEAHKALIKEQKGMHLKASVTMVVTDYKKMRYAYVGNSRFYLIRNQRYLIQTKDQSLTQTMLQQEQIPLDQAAIHEERNNLYSYLGERGQPDVQLSKRIPLENGDILAQLTRGIWEQCSEEELLAAIQDVKEPREVLERVEDGILGQQEEQKDIDNYTLAITFVRKTYQSPKKKISLKKILLVAIPILLLAGGISLGLYLRHRSIQNKESRLEQYQNSGEAYLRYDNYQKASEEYAEAKKLADSLNKEKEQKEADRYQKLADQINAADEDLLAGEYKKAETAYLAACTLSVAAGNVGKTYIDQQLSQTAGYIEVYDLIALGEGKESYEDLNGAIENYKQAREKAAALYYAEGKEEAGKKQAAAEEKLEIARQSADAAKEKAAKKEAAKKKAAAKTKADAAKAKEEAAKAKEEAKAEEAAAKAEEENAQKEAEKKEKAAQLELENQKKANDQKNAIELENQGNELLAAGKYQNAITYYKTAQAIYKRLELTELARELNDKIAAAKAGIKADQSQETK